MDFRFWTQPCVQDTKGLYGTLVLFESWESTSCIEILVKLFLKYAHIFNYRAGSVGVYRIADPRLYIMMLYGRYLGVGKRVINRKIVRY